MEISLSSKVLWMLELELQLWQPWEAIMLVERIMYCVACFVNHWLMESRGTQKIYKTEFSDVVLLEMPGCNLGRNKQIRNRLVKCSTIANLGWDGWKCPVGVGVTPPALLTPACTSSHWACTSSQWSGPLFITALVQPCWWCHSQAFPVAQHLRINTF